MAKRRFPSINLIYFVVISGVLIAAGWYAWKQYKYKIASDQLKGQLFRTTDGLYSLGYDYLHFDEISGSAQLRNVRIIPDTSRIAGMTSDQLPAVLLNVTIDTITIRGVKTLRGNDISGDTVIIHHPKIIMYILKPIEKKTLLEDETKTVYREILGRLNSIKVGFVDMNDIQISAINFRTGKKNFDAFNGKIKMNHVLIDSLHNGDSSRVLFSTEISLEMDSLYTYNNNRPELIIKNVSFLGTAEKMRFDRIMLNRFDDAQSTGKILLDASFLRFSGLNTDAIAKEKNFEIDSILCEEVKIYQPPREGLPDLTPDPNTEVDTSSGFQNSYSIDLKYLGLENVNFISAEKSKFDLGRIKFRLHHVYADRLAMFVAHPLNCIREATLEADYIKMQSKDKMYALGLQKIQFNTLDKSVRIASAYSSPSMSESNFANYYKYQKDRYNTLLKDIVLKGVQMNDIFDNKVNASQLLVQQASLKIYRDLNKPLEPKSKTKNYPGRVLEQVDFPIHIDQVIFPSLYLEYREKQVKSGEVGVVTFNNTSLNISNITNNKQDYLRNNVLDLNFSTLALGTIPLKGEFKFRLGDKSQSFVANGTVGTFNARTLNTIAAPMALIQAESGKITSIDFSFKGDTSGAGGPMTMRYEDLKINVIKKKKYPDGIEKNSFLSLLANIVIEHDNPRGTNLITEEPFHKANPYKSFFNLVWKTLFQGMMKTIGVP